MARLTINLANRLLPNRLKLNCNGLEVDFDNCSFTHNSVILKIGNEIKARLFWINEKQQELRFNEELSKFNIENKGFDVIVKEQDFDNKNKVGNKK